MFRSHLDPDGTLPKQKDYERRRSLELSRHRDGSYRLAGRLIPEAGLAWQPIVDALSAPQPATAEVAVVLCEGRE